jgi:hypothetical protein
LIRHLQHLLLSRLCTLLSVILTATVWCSFLRRNCTSQNLRHAHKFRFAVISEISPTHRSSPLATQQTTADMSVASLDAPHWEASEVVLLDIGTFMQLPPRVRAKTPRCCNQPAPTSAMYAVFRFAGRPAPSGHDRQRTTRCLVVLFRALLPQIPHATATSCDSHVSIAPPICLQPL